LLKTEDRLPGSIILYPGSLLPCHFLFGFCKRKNRQFYYRFKPIKRLQKRQFFI